MKRRHFVEIISSLFILLFIYTATSKFLSFPTFKWALSMSPFIGKTLAPIVAWGLPILEIGIALLLLFPKTRTRGLWASFLIMSFFTAYLTYMLVFVPHLPCNCGGVLQQMSWKQHLVFNIFFTLLAAVGVRLNKLNSIPSTRIKYSASA